MTKYAIPDKWFRIVRDARARGLRVHHDGIKCEVRRGSVALRFYEDGTAIRADVRLDLAQSIRSERVARLVLEVPS